MSDDSYSELSDTESVTVEQPTAPTMAPAHEHWHEPETEPPAVYQLPPAVHSISSDSEDSTDRQIRWLQSVSDPDRLSTDQREELQKQIADVAGAAAPPLAPATPFSCHLRPSLVGLALACCARSRASTWPPRGRAPSGCRAASSGRRSPCPPGSSSRRCRTWGRA